MLGGRRLAHQFKADVVDEVSEAAPDVGRSASLDLHGAANSLGEVAVADVDVERRPIGLDE